MNKKEKIKELKSLVKELDSSEKVLKQSLAVITSRKKKLTEELDGLGATNSAQKGKIKNVLSDNQEIGLLASLTN